MDQRIYAMVTWRKTGRLRFLGHLDIARTIERAVRRAGLPVVYSKGYNPTAQISFLSALPLGTAAENELCAIQLSERVRGDQVREALSEQLPPDLGVVDVDVVSVTGRRLFAGLTVAEYRVELWPEDAPDPDDLAAAVARVWAAKELVITRETKSRTRQIDIRPGIHSLAVAEPGDDSQSGPVLVMALAFESDKLVKPAEVLECIASRLQDTTGAAALSRPRRITRLGIY